MQRKQPRLSHTILAAAIILALAWIVSPRTPHALAGDPSGQTYSLRLLAIPENGAAVLIDQSNRAWLYTAGARQATAILNDSNQHLLIR
ncbi:MAG: hypothetical protein AB7G17_03475 [Phycisphaerales bacterium]